MTSEGLSTLRFLTAALRRALLLSLGGHIGCAQALGPGGAGTVTGSVGPRDRGRRGPRFGCTWLHHAASDVAAC